LQFFDASLIAGWEHLYFAALNALNAFKSRNNVSNSVAMETLLYASAQRQIKEALELIGIKPGTQHVAVLIMSQTQKQADGVLRTVSQLLGDKLDDSVLALTDDKTDGIRKMFEISDAELEAKLQREGLEKQTLMDMVLEHMALLVTQR
jgi:tRNA threonylcarbamoyladenosine modification (KEOPS) complex Cgi121 subunit